MYDKEFVKQLRERFKEYIDNKEIPIIAEFAYKNEVPRKTLYDLDGFSPLLKKCRDKKEAALESKALKGGVNVTMAIFSLKQLGWRDKVSVESANVNINASVTNEKELDSMIDKYLDLRNKDEIDITRETNDT
jgi:hypothetical protein